MVQGACLHVAGGSRGPGAILLDVLGGNSTWQESPQKVRLADGKTAPFPARGASWGIPVTRYRRKARTESLCPPLSPAHLPISQCGFGK